MKVAIGQINPTPNDFAGNCRQITEGMEFAVDADVVVFPELSVCGYLCQDLMHRADFIEHNLQALHKLAEYSRKDHLRHLTTVVGYIGRNHKGRGKPFTNMAAVIRNGQIIAQYQKQLLPFYDVFDEGRWFEAGTELCVVEIAGKRCAITICEDVWNDKGQDDYNHQNNPLQTYRAVEPEVIINLSSSPYALTKPRTRFKMLKQIARESGQLVVYVNQIGGQDELTFDGGSCVLDGRQGQDKTIFLAPSTSSSQAQYFLIDTNKTPEKIYSKTGIHPDEDIVTLHNAILVGLRDYIKKNGFTKVVIGSSGGVDSAAVATLACQAIGPENVHCIMMPNVCFSSAGSVNDAKTLHANLGCHEHLVEFDHRLFLGQINAHLGLDSRSYYPVANENIQARMRGQIVMHFSNATGALPLTTGNKTELALGYCTLYGDMNGGFNPICDLLKTRTYGLLHYINNVAKRNGETPPIPDSILNKAPSAELAEGQTDEASLLPYFALDPIVLACIENHIHTFGEFQKWVKAQGSVPTCKGGKDYASAEEVLELVSQAKYQQMIKRIDRTEFKRRQAAPGLKLSSIAFGTGRRYPITQIPTIFA